MAFPFGHGWPGTESTPSCLERQDLNGISLSATDTTAPTQLNRHIAAPPAVGDRAGGSEGIGWADGAVSDTITGTNVPATGGDGRINSAKLLAPTKELVDKNAARAGNLGEHRVRLEARATSRSLSSRD